MIAALLLLLSGCTSSDKSNDPIVQEDFITKEFSNDVMEYAITELEKPFEHSDKFYVDIISFEYDENNSQVCTTFTINDPVATDATYYAVLQEKDSIVTHEQVNIGTGGGTLHFDACFSNWLAFNPYRILIGKIDPDDMINDNLIAGVATIDFTVNKYNVRSKIVPGGLRFDTQDIDDLSNAYSLVNVEMDFWLTDTGNIIDEVYFEIYELDNNRLIDTITRDGNTNDYQLTIQNLVPHVEYEVVVYLKIVDGDVIIDKQEYDRETITLPGVHDFRYGDVTHDMLAQIVSFDTTDDGWEIRYFIHDNEYALDSGGNRQEYDLVIYDTSMNEVDRIQLDKTKTLLDLPLDTLVYSNEIRIETRIDNIYLSSRTISQPSPLFESAVVVDGVITVNFKTYMNEIINFSTILSMYSTKNDGVLFTNILETTDSQTYTIIIDNESLANVNEHDKLYLFIDFEFISLEGTTGTYYNRVLVDIEQTE